MKLRIATRRSALALVQTRWVAAELRRRNPGLEIDEVHVVTTGDKVLDVPLAQIGGKGLFVSEVEATLADGRADLAVHSMKDVPTELAAGLEIVCIPKREDPRDALVSLDGAELDALEAGSRVGTSSLRRVLQLRARRNDLAYETLRGNVDTRLRRLEEGRFRAIVLASAGLRRLGLIDRPHVLLSTEQCLPAVGQGALAIEARIDDEATRALLAPLEDRATRLCVEAERTFLRDLEGGCQIPIAAHAHFDGGRLALDAIVGAADGAEIVSAGSEAYTSSTSLHDAHRLGHEVAAEIIARGGRALVEAARALVKAPSRA